jgi:hypothetical protein
MFFIYSINFDNLAIKLYDFSKTKQGINDLIENVAKDFIRVEQGERAAENPFRDEVLDANITEDGYFLRHSSVSNEIDVYQRKTIILQGHIWNSYDIQIKKIMKFGFIEAALNLPIETTGKGIIKQEFKTSLDAQKQAEHLKQLKERLVLQREKVDKQIQLQEEYIPLISLDDTSSYSDTDSTITSDFSSNWTESDTETETDSDDEYFENPTFKLQRILIPKPPNPPPIDTRYLPL